MHLKYFFLNLILLHSTQSFCQVQDSQLLKEAYTEESKGKLSEFCRSWQKEIPAITNTEFAKLSDTLKNTYQLFTTFYNDRVCCGQDNPTGKMDSSFILIQNSVEVFFTISKFYYSNLEIDSIALESLKTNLTKSQKGSLLHSIEHEELDSIIIAGNSVRASIFDKKPVKKIQKKDYSGYMRMIRDNTLPAAEVIYRKRIDSVIDFRPNFNCNARPLFLNREKYSLLEKQFGILYESRYKPEFAEKVKFLRSVIRFGPAGGFETAARFLITSIIFDQNMENAIINYSDYNGGGKVVMHKENEEWKSALSHGEQWQSME